MSDVSIIIPIYKAEKYLSKCLDSILSQTITDFELLLINDGSPDNSGKICEQYAIKDSRIKVFHKNNGGVSSARNLGLDNAAGKWVAFIDSDDWIEATYLENLLKGNYEAELRISGYTQHFIGIKSYIPNNEAFLSGNFQSFFEKHLSSHLMGTPWGKLFLLKIINDNQIRFNTNLSFGEDTLFNFNYLKIIKNIIVQNYSEYHWQFTRDSLSSKLSEKKVEDYCNMYEENVLTPMLKLYKTSNIIKKHVVRKRFSFLIMHIEMLYSLGIPPIEKRRRLKTLFAQVDPSYNYLFIGGLSKIGVITAFSYYFFPIIISDFIFSILLKLKK